MLMATEKGKDWVFLGIVLEFIQEIWANTHETRERL